MTVAVAQLLRCPFCRTPVRDEGDRLVCASCSRTFGLTADGIPLMVHADLSGAAAKLAEAAAWPEKARAEGWYEPDDAVDAALPFVNRELGWDDLNWLANGHSFQVLLDRYVDGERPLRVLEVGAAKAWAAPHWRALGCEYVATDVLVDRNIGLGRGAFYGDFARIQADGENLPFADGSFDIAYCVAALHHALDLRRMVGEMARVTRTGGIVAGLNEGARGLFRSGENPDQAGEKALGINEHVHSAVAYADAFWRAGISIRRIERSDGWTPKILGPTLGRVPKVGTTLATLWHASAATYVGISLYGRRR